MASFRARSGILPVVSARPIRRTQPRSAAGSERLVLYGRLSLGVSWTPLSRLAGTHRRANWNSAAQGFDSTYTAPLAEFAAAPSAREATHSKDTMLGQTWGYASAR